MSRAREILADRAYRPTKVTDGCWESLCPGCVSTDVMYHRIPTLRINERGDGGVDFRCEHHDDPAVRALLGLPPVPGSGRDPFVRLADVEEREIEWFWPDRIAMASVAVVAGDGGVGKSTVVQDLAARLTRGDALPGGEPMEPRGVMILSAEEDASAVIRPRMRLAGADLTRVVVLDVEGVGLRLPSGAAALEQRCISDDIRLVVVDTGPAFMDEALGSNSEEGIRRFLVPLKEMAERHRMVILVLAHLNKDSGRTAAHRIMGGAAWRNAPRQVLIVGAPPGEDPRETGERMIAVEKNNLGAYPPTLAFRLAPAKDNDSYPVIVWGEEVEDVSATDLVGDPLPREDRPARQEAAEFLAMELAGGPVPSRTLREAAAKAGIAWRTIERVKDSVGAEVTKTGGFGDKGAWTWTIPGARDHRPPDDPSQTSPEPGGLSPNPVLEGRNHAPGRLSPPGRGLAA